MCPRERDPQENGLWHPVGSGTPVPGTGTAAGKVISACLLSRQTILCLCEAAPAISCPPAPRGFQLTCRELPGALLSAWRWFQQVLAAGNQKDSNHTCRDPGERGEKPAGFTGRRKGRGHAGGRIKAETGQLGGKLILQTGLLHPSTRCLLPLLQGNADLN